MIVYNFFICNFSDGQQSTTGQSTIIVYNHFNLPVSFTGPGLSVTNLYTADGRKLRTTTVAGGTTTVKNYINGLEFTGSAVDALYYGNGRVYYGGTTTPEYQYNLTDHLGNTRVMFADLDGDDIIEENDGEVLQEHHYYPFGLEMDGPWNNYGVEDSEYRYNGKELLDDVGLYAYGFRYYDPAIGRFTGVDPISDKFPHVSVYNYAENEPIAHIDLHGLQKYPAHKAQQLKQKYPHTTAFLQAGGLARLAHSSQIQRAIEKWTPESKRKYGPQITLDLSFGRGPILDFKALDVENGDFDGRWGYSSGYGDLGVGYGLMDRNEVIDIDLDLVEEIEAAVESGDIDRINGALLTFSSTVLHEYTHYVAQK